jgi:hypothetical protein
MNESSSVNPRSAPAPRASRQGEVVTCGIVRVSAGAPRVQRIQLLRVAGRSARDAAGVSSAATRRRPGARAMHLAAPDASGSPNLRRGAQKSQAAR